MKKLLLSTLLIASAFVSTNAQIVDGTIAPNFTGTDLNGDPHTLYSYLDSGYTVVLDISATWCGPCWSYHTSGALENLYIDHGPSGMANVSAGTTDDVMVMFIEGDASTGLADLQGSTSGTQGNWIANTPYPIIDNANIAHLFDFEYYPTIITIYPDRHIEESGTLTAAGHYANIGTSLPSHAATNGSMDAEVIVYTGNTSNTCSNTSISMNITIQNRGDVTLPAGALVEVLDGTTVLGSTTTSVALDLFEVTSVTIPTNILVATNTTIKVTATGDSNTSNDTQQTTLYSVYSTSLDVTVEINTDQYGSETTWELKYGSTVLASGGPYTDAASSGSYPQPSASVTLDPNKCYMLKVVDSYGDGIEGNYGSGFVRVKDAAGHILTSVSKFSSTGIGRPKTPLSLGVDENNVQDLTIYPNPFTSNATISFENGTAVNTEVIITNTVGQVMNHKKLGEVSGFQNIQLDGRSLSAGVYFVTIKAGTSTTTSRVILNK